MGNAVNFLLTAAKIRSLNGELSLRIDDIDFKRVRPEYVQDIFKSLEYLEIDWDHGPINVDDFFQNYSQLKKIELYREFMFSGNLALYKCDCSRKMISTSLYPGTCRNRHLKSQDYSWRVDTQDNQILSQSMGDFILWRKDDLPSYQLVSVYEDEYQKMTHIMRGEDLLSSTQAQKFISQKLNLQFFPKINFYHHGLINDETGHKLSKSQGASRLQLYSRQEIFNLVTQTLGFSVKLTSLRDLIELMSEHDETNRH